jgi:hypothetical protein
MPRPCTVCRNPQREDIDSTLINGGSFRNISKRFKLGITAVFRHKRDHIPKTLLKAAEAKAEAREIERGEDLLEQIRDLNERTLKILKQAETACDAKTALAAIRETRANQEFLIKMVIGQQYWIIPSIIRSHHDHTTNANRLERERSAKFIVTWVKTAAKSHSKIQGS